MDKYEVNSPQREVLSPSVEDELTGFQHQILERIISEPQRLIFKRVASNAQSLVMHHLEWLVDEYLKYFGRVVDTDLARQLFPDWISTHEFCEIISAAIFEPARVVARRVWEKLLSEPLGPDEANYIIFITGGPASGKGMVRELLIRNLVEGEASFPHIIFDTTMSEYTIAKAQVEQALSRGFVVYDLYIHRPVQDAKKGAEERRKLYGRAVEESILVDSHWEAQQTLFRLANDYRDVTNVIISIIDNSGLPEDIHFGSIETTLEPQKYLSREDIVRRLDIIRKDD